MYFRLGSEITDVEVIARGVSVRERARLRAQFGRGRWRTMKGIALVELRGWDDQACGSTLARSPWDRATQGQDQAVPRLMANEMKQGFVVCLRNDDAEDLVVRKLYAVIADEEAAARGFVRVIDESGEDYLYPSTFFAQVSIPDDLAHQLLTPR